MKIYDLCVNEGLASGIYRCRAAIGGLNFKICGVCFDMLFVLMRYAVGGGNFIEDRLCGAVVATACALRAALAAKGRERRGRFAALAAAVAAIAVR